MELLSAPSLHEGEQLECDVKSRLDKAANQRMSFNQVATAARTEFGVNTTLSQLQIPASCNCIAYQDIDATITSFIMLVQKQCGLPVDQLQKLQSKLEVVETIQENASRYLGRLELIYQLSCTLQRWLDNNGYSTKGSLDRWVTGTYPFLSKLFYMQSKEVS